MHKILEQFKANFITAAEALRSRGLVVGSRQEGRRKKKKKEEEEEGRRDKTLNKPLESSKGCWMKP